MWKCKEDMIVFKQFRQLFFEAVIASMIMVKKFQSGSLSLSSLLEVKGNGTLKVECDIRSGEAALFYLRQLPADVFELRFEDIPRRKGSSGARYRAENDNLDGTRIFTNGGNSSTVILGIFDQTENRYVSAIIGEPASGRIWTADLETKTQRMNYMNKNLWLTQAVPVHVCDGVLDGQATVFVDPFEVGFPLGKAQYAKLLGNIMELGASAEKPNEAAHVMILGSNGLHQALVANGGQGAVGGIMTAKGGPWDAAGALLVIQAGGSAVGLKLEADGTLTEQDALNPDSYDFLVYGNTAETVSALVGAVRDCLK